MSKPRTEIEPVVVDLWPEAGRALNLGKSRTYKSARTGEIPTIQFGKCLKVPLRYSGKFAMARVTNDDRASSRSTL